MVETPGMIKLNAWQLGKLVRVVSGTESIVGGSRRDDKRASDELVDLAGDGIQDDGVRERHGAVRDLREEEASSLIADTGSWVNVYPSPQPRNSRGTNERIAVQ